MSAPGAQSWVEKGRKVNRGYPAHGPVEVIDNWETCGMHKQKTKAHKSQKGVVTQDRF